MKQKAIDNDNNDNNNNNNNNNKIMIIIMIIIIMAQTQCSVNLLRSRFLGCQETAAHIRTTFLSIVWPITAFVPFLRTLSRQIRPLRLVQSEIIFIFPSHGGKVMNQQWRLLKKLSFSRLPG